MAEIRIKASENPDIVGAVEQLAFLTNPQLFYNLNQLPPEEVDDYLKSTLEGVGQLLYEAAVEDVLREWLETH